MIVDEAMALTMYEQGDLDVVSVSQADVESIKANPMLSSELHVPPSEAPLIAPGCLPTLAYPAAQLTKPCIVRSYGLLGREKWENWDIY
jgi:hypothetical protein